MAKYSRIEVINTMRETGLVPLFYDDDIDNCIKLIDTLYEGGARLLEFTARGGFAEEVFAQLNKYALSKLPGMILGVGSVTDGSAASRFMALEANFVVTPVLREDVAVNCNRRKVLWSPGCGSLSEIAKAEELGCEIVKLFPGDVYGPDFIKGIKGPQPWTSIMPTGGVSPTKENLEKWFEAGATCVGIGSKLIKKDSAGSYDFEYILKTTKYAIEVIKTLKA
ncbi:bifunctional 4-hydroxy-2-oxoglutarate aldolase/2-dehydro-3-deoxy-phosphogluconate aldolase [uncultured Psychroserpens sp.]|uniref:bifunctional 4-hydroxy-2-oxoglutarate aldolase/2-dehydro-3-deoxy-phosphogluconate aldolase n=1 Tax=uncultured Psychroserpens sp. TaxID=255436 RepID=UPI00260F3998|nr:bifunctional 4-hydroxy-2-oxoglutarate aldolase/2-dehydro-3-deoxy-phosphogluconate aldolase [uncultured Psychroserpens sp.]